MGFKNIYMDPLEPLELYHIDEEIGPEIKVLS